MLGQKGGFPVASQLEAEPRPSLCISPFPAWELHPWTQDTFTGQAQAALWGTHSAPPPPQRPREALLDTQCPGLTPNTAAPRVFLGRETCAVPPPAPETLASILPHCAQEAAPQRGDPGSPQHSTPSQKVSPPRGARVPAARGEEGGHG